MLFSIQILIENIGKLIFSAFGKILVFANCFFYLNSNEKSIEFFCSFWQDLGFGECFFLFKFEFKKYWKMYFFRYTLHFSDEVIAEFVLPKKYLPELEKYILCMFFIFYVSVFFNSWNALKIVRFPIPYSMYSDSIINANEKTAKHRLTKCLKRKKRTPSLKKQFWP